MLKILFPVVAILGLFLLIRSVLRLTKTFTGSQQEFSAKAATVALRFDTPGEYEIDVKRPAIIGVISLSSSFEIVSKNSGEAIHIRKSGNVFAGRKDLSGARIVPISTFTIITPGEYIFRNLSIPDFQDKDHLIVMPKVGAKGALAILATVFSGLLFVGGLVLSLLAFKGKI